MKRICIRSLVLLCIVLLFVIAPAEVRAATVASGDNGNGTSWTLSDDGTLTVTGNGTLYSQWDSYADSITTVVINPGITAFNSYLFSNYENLTTVILPEGLTNIGSYSFSGCINLSSINLPDTLNTISTCAFQNCTSLTSITIPNGVKTVGNYVFYGCTNLSTVNLPDTLTTIGPGTFRDCTSLTSFTIPNGVKTVGNYAFYGCTNLSTVNLPDTLTAIGDYAFRECDSLTSITIPNGINTLGSATFYGCNNLSTVNLPDTLTTIAPGTFRDCISLTTCTIPNGVKTVGNYAFYGCTNLATVDLPDTLTTIGYYAFSECDSLTSITIPNGVEATDSAVFYGCNNLSTVNLPDTLIFIGSATFRDCTSLTTCTIPSNVETVGSYAFYGCTNLASVDLPDTLTTLGIYAFYGCKSLTSITIPGGVQTVASHTFFDCANLSTVNFPETLTSIEYCAFNGCKSLTSITIPDGIETIAAESFKGCTNLSTVNLPDTVTSIGRYAFYECKNLTSITIPNSVETIGSSSFKNCYALKSIVIPASVTSIGSNTFAGCRELGAVTFCGDKPSFDGDPFSSVIAFCYYPVGNTTYSKVANLGDTLVWLEEGTQPGGQVGSSEYLTWTLSQDNKLTITATRKAAIPDFETDSNGNLPPWQNIRKLIYSVEISENVTRIGNNAFYYCVNLVSVNLPTTLKTIGSTAFYNCALTSVTLPENLISIGSSAFFSCDNLASVSIPKTVTTISSSAFSNTGLKMVSVPGSVTSLGNNAFAGCIDLTSVTLGNGITSISNGTFSRCSNLESVTLPESVTSIGSSAFQDCESLSSITLPRNVSSLGSSAFKNCVSLISINLPAQIRSINKHTFYECSALETVTFTGDAPTSIDSEAFLNVYATVYYPKDNTTWASSTYKDYGGDLTWESLSMPKLKILQAPDTYVAVANGEPAKVTIKAEGEDLQYTWYYYDIEAGMFKVTKSFTGNYYKVTMNPARDGRCVYCVITDKYGNRYVSDHISLHMVEATLQITQQPKGVAVGNKKPAKVTVKAEGEGLKYTWYVKDAGKTKFTKSSITTSSYSVTMTASRSGRQVYCVVRDKNGNEVVSDTVTISRITISKQPEGDAGKSNERVSATVKATGDGIKYQWYVKDAGKTKFTKSSITKATYGYNMTSAKSGRQAYCVITDKYGNSVTTDTITFSRITISKQPEGDVGKSNERVTATVKASGDGLKYQWYVKDVGKTRFSKSSTTKSTYSYTMTAAKSGRQAYCVITDIYGNSVTTKTVTFSRLYIKTQPSSVTVASGDPAKVTVKAVGDTLTYTWYVKNPGESSFTKSSVTKSSYSVTMNRSRSGRQVYCVITDIYGNTVKTNTVTLKMK